MPDITVYSRTPRSTGGFECGGQRITLTGPIKNGGEGGVYAVKYSEGICAKVYYKEKINAELHNKIKAMIKNPPGENLTGENDSQRSTLISWAISALYDSNLPDAHFIGFTMPLIDTSMFREAHRYYDPDDRIKYLGGTFSWLYLLTAAFNIASVVSAIHQKGHRIGDMSASNILVARTAAVSFIDCDSFQITDAASKKTYYTKVATGDFLPPELMGKNFRTDNIDRYYSDLFALGIIIFKFLMNGFHPYQARGTGVEKLPTIEAKIKQGKFAYEGTFADVKAPKNAPPYAMISPELRKLFHLCFVTGHAEKEKRPSAAEWATALKNEIATIQRCSRNENHYYSGSLKKCPWCAIMAASPERKDPFPPNKVSKEKDAPNITVSKITTSKQISGGKVAENTRNPQPVHPAQPAQPAQPPSKVKTPILSITPVSVDTKVMRNGDAEFAIKVENTGDGTLTGTLRSDSEWLIFRANSGKNINFSADRVFETVVRINSSKLPGKNTIQDALFIGKIFVTSNGGRKEIPVKISFLKDPKLKTDCKKIIIKDADIALNQDSVIKSGFTVTNEGDGILTGTITSKHKWMRAVPDKISVADSVSVTVEIDTEKAPNNVLLFGKLNVETNGGNTEITVGVTIKK